MTSPNARFAVLLSVAAAATVALVVARGGHLSVDSVQHAFEAVSGRSVSTQPPAMAAWLAWLGASADLDAALARHVLAMVLLIAIGLWLPTLALPRARSRAWWLLAGAMPFSPLLLLYPGIVWKDVTFAAVLVLASGLLVAATLARQPRGRVVGVAIVVAVLAAVLALLRPQGLVLWPLLLGWAVWLAAGPASRWLAGAGVVVLSLLCGLLLAYAVDDRIPGHDGRSQRASLLNLVRFDLAGIESRQPGTLETVLEAPAPAAIAAREHHQPQRGDGLSAAPAYLDWLRSHDNPALLRMWWQAVRAAPRAYAGHRADAAAWLWGLNDPRSCLPVHLGIEGLPTQMSRLPLVAGPREADIALYAALEPALDSPLFRPALYALALLLAVVLALARRGKPVRQAVLGVFALATIYALSTSAITFACDLRYLFPLVPLASLAGIVLALRADDDPA